ncbi:hypothetical protein [Shewanella sp. HL-SH2]|uniref:hypothetical protein n=1 Tax=Shewanella sp. HL-SH2 TaxID=3436238 RepID=UPI003EBF56AD
MSGKVIDGYVSGATVWLDINGNSIFDVDSEPSAISGAAGEYAFEFTPEHAECVPYSTMYVDVPVGAIDEDTGPVTEAYQMALPPSITPLTDDEIRHISPLTSLLWEQISAKLKAAQQPILSCENLKNNVQLTNDLQNEIRLVMIYLVTHYNLSEAQIFADFIADNNTQAYEIAQAIVIGLKASFGHKANIQAQYPDAVEIRVIIYQDKNKDEKYQFDNAWYRETFVSLSDGWILNIVKMEQDLFEVDIILSDVVAHNSSWGDQTFAGKLQFRKDAYYDIERGYNCSASEQITFKKDNIEYQLTNIPKFNSVNAMSECTQNLEVPLDRMHTVSFSENGMDYFAEFIFREADPEFASLPDWINMKDKAQQLNATELIEHLSILPKGWDEHVSIGTYHWRKRMNNSMVQIDKNSLGEWTKATRQDDGTMINECSTDGEIWTGCN